MSKVIADISVSLDGFVAGPHDGPGNPLGDRGDRLHQWVYGLASWREMHGLEGGERNQDADLMGETWSRTGAYVRGKRMFASGEEPWGEEPPFRGPVFVLTHTPPASPWSRRAGPPSPSSPTGSRARLPGRGRPPAARTWPSRAADR
ncbi:hypothetical protein [Streptomyces sp. 7N604]|uniref:hypothetical protein n=1 Tax=Streptomyces sp. 7N604 TaxID=3457415 RepID=UPI003FD1ABC1